MPRKYRAWCVFPLLGLTLAGCTAIFGGENIQSITLHRPADGAKAECLSGTYATGGLLPWLAGTEASVRRNLLACVTACRRRGFVEDGIPISGSDGTEAQAEGASIPTPCQ